MMNRRRFGLTLMATAAATSVSSGVIAEPLIAAPLTAEQDHRRLLDLLGIDSLRPGADGYDMAAPNAANFDEAGAGLTGPLPELLVRDDGRPVTMAADWPARRAELVEHFEREIYGRQPASTPAVTWRVVESKTDVVGDIPVRVDTLSGALAGSATVIEATLFHPLSVGATPVPAVIALAFPAALIARFPPEPGVPWREQVLASGRAVVEYVPTSVQADNGAGLSDGVIGASGGGAPRGLHDWGALRAWAWGAGRVLDHLQTLVDIDAGKVSIFGLSRYGKAALVAMAFDTRFAAAFVASSGAGGAKLLRRDFGERIGNLASSGEYHWFAGEFLKYAGPMDAADLPVDAHSLIALCAPRPVFISVGTMEADRWTDPHGMFLAAAAARPVYRLLGARPFDEDDMPAPLVFANGDLAFRQHEGGHTGGPNWPTFLNWVSART